MAKYRIVNGYMVKFNRPKAKIVERPKLFGKTITWDTPHKLYSGRVIGSFYYPGGGGYFVLLPYGKVVQCQGAYEIVEPQ
jgi:hypothetical protein